MIIDISNHQPPDRVDYGKIAGQIDGAILRAAYGTGAPNQFNGKDPSFDRHYQELHSRGVPIGAYHYITEYHNIDAQAQLFLETVRGKEMKLGYWCDAELESMAEPLTAKSVIRWMQLVEAELGECGIYTGQWCWLTIMGNEYARYSSRKLWMSAYTASPDNYIPHGWNSYYLWQYTSSGRLDGYNGNLDMSKRNLNMTDILLNVPQFSQKDTRWNWILLGTSKSNIGGYGCLMVNAAMVARYYGHDVNPAQMNQLLIDNGGYVNGNLFVFGALTDIFPDVVIDWNNFINCIDTPAPLGTIDAMLLAGYPVIVMVDFNPSDADIDQHWVTIVGKQNGSYIINDPIDGARVTFESRYGDPARYIFRIVVYKGTPAVIPDEEPLYRVRVRDGVTSLKIRSEPIVATRTDTGKRAKAPEEYNVYEERQDVNYLFGRIGISRWIALSFTQRITPIEPPELTLEERVARLEKAVFG